jgi:hypothetical protein
MIEQNKNDLKKLAKELSIRGYARRSNFILSMAGEVHVMPSNSNGDSIWLALTQEGHGIVSYDSGIGSTAIYYKGIGDSHEEFGTEWQIQWSPDQENWMPTSSIIVTGGRYNGRSPTNTHKGIIRRLHEHSLRSQEKRKQAEEAEPQISPQEDEGERAQRVESPRATRPWSEVQIRLTQMGGKREDGESLRIDGIWGDNTNHAWGQVTNGATRPSNPDSAMETLEEIEEEIEEEKIREQDGAARQEDIPRSLLAAYLMYDEDRLSLAGRDGLFGSAGLTVADSHEKAQDLIDDITSDRVTELYNTDKAAYGAADGSDERNFRIILTGFLRRKLAEDDSSDSGSTEISLRDYYNPSGTNIFMRKTDGTLFYGMRNGDRDVLYPIENRTQTRGGGPDYLNLREQRKMLREVRREHRRGSDRYMAYQDIIQGQRKFETGERNIFDPSGRGERGEGQREEGRAALRDTSDSGRTRKQRRQERRQKRQQRRSERRG